MKQLFTVMQLRQKGVQIATLQFIEPRVDPLHIGDLVPRQPTAPAAPVTNLPQLHRWNAQRRELAKVYDEMLGGAKGIQVLRRSPESVCHLYVIRAERRDKLRDYLTKLGIGTGIHYPVPLHLHPAFAAAKQKKGDLPHAERAAKEILSLPLWPQLPEQQVREVAEAVLRFYDS